MQGFSLRLVHWFVRSQVTCGRCFAFLIVWSNSETAEVRSVAVQLDGQCTAAAGRVVRRDSGPEAGAHEGLGAGCGPGL